MCFLPFLKPYKFGIVVGVIGVVVVVVVVVVVAIVVGVVGRGMSEMKINS